MPASRNSRLTPREARKLALHSQEILATRRSGKAIDVTHNTIEHLGYVQIDTISVIQRAHHHTLWNRNPRYKPDHLGKLLAQRRVFEYWSHAAAYLPMSDYRFYMPNMASIEQGRQLWFNCDPGVKQQVYRRIVEEGPLQARDFEDKKNSRLAMWEWKPAKIALEQLFMEGRLMVARREGFQKVYDLRERVLPDWVDTSIPSEQEFCRFLVRSYLRAHGLGKATEIGYLRKGIKSGLQKSLEEMTEAGELVNIEVKGESYKVLPDSLALLEKPLARSRLRILSPFDNLVIQRKRLGTLFGFDYQIECYVPQAKRKHGYFCLPIAWNGGLYARMDCKADRKTGTLIIRYLAIEPKLRKADAFAQAFATELQRFIEFNQCDKLAVEGGCDSRIRSALEVHFG